MFRKLLVCIAFLSSFAALAGSEAKIADQWLQSLDEQQYSYSWQQADDYFQAHITQAKWQKVAKAVRSPIGEIRSRTLIESQAYEQLPGVPDGEYVVMSFQSSFSHKSEAIETLTLSRASGDWKVIGYFIH